MVTNGERVTQIEKLREPFPPELVGTLPRGNVQLQYVGHGAVTSRLLDVDPEWSWEPYAIAEDGTPLFDLSDKGEAIGLWINLTVLGVTRPGYGSVMPGAFDAKKQLIGDALRNAAMRFGVALDLWIKGTAEDHESNVRPPAPQVEAETRGKIKGRFALLPDDAKERIASWLAGSDLTIEDFPPGWVDGLEKALTKEETKAREDVGETGVAGARKALGAVRKSKETEAVIKAFPGSTVEDGGDAA